MQGKRKFGFLRHDKPYEILLEPGKLDPDLLDGKKVEVMAKTGQFSEYAAVFHGPKVRARKTALKASGMKPVIQLDGLDAVNVDEAKLGELKPLFDAKWLENWASSGLPGLESAEDVYKRVFGALRAIISVTREDEKILIVAHSETYYVIMAIVNKITISEAIEKFKKIEPAELREFEVELDEKFGIKEDN